MLFILQVSILSEQMVVVDGQSNEYGNVIPGVLQEVYLALYFSYCTPMICGSG